MDRNRSGSEEIAIVGIACRLPGGTNSLDELWTALADGRDLVTEVPPNRFDVSSFLAPDPRQPGKSYSLAGGFLDEVEGFDAEYFGISPREAGRIDPQQRLALELAVEALDDAAIHSDVLKGSDTGVFIGVAAQHYAALQERDPASMNAYTMAGGSTGNTANRVSHALDLHGPSMAVDTACSSSLVAVHQACQALLGGTGRVMLAGGVNVLLSPHHFVGFSKASMLSPSGRCRTFSAAADGYVPAEGGAVVVLKRLSDALEDGDRIHGVILGTGTNADGHTSGLSLPSAAAQEALLRQVYRRAEVSPDDLAYFEAHGTGTAAGDPVECEAIGRALSRYRHEDLPLPVGSVKTNLGHLEPASGMAGLCKALLVLRERAIPPSLHTEPLNQDIDFTGLRLRPVTAAQPIHGSGRAVVGVNSFGFGGANAHVVLAEPAPAQENTQPPPRRALPIVVSARSAAALADAAERMSSHLLGVPAERFYDTCRTAVLRRTHHEHRAVVMAVDPGSAAEQLEALAKDAPVSGTATAVAVGKGRVGFVFSGNGSTWSGMGADLLSDPAFRAGVDEVDSVLSPLLGWSVGERLAGPPEAAEMARTEVAQPLLFTLQVALVNMLRRQGIVPAAVMGHSVGEIAAACTAGAIDLATAAAVVAARSHCQEATAGLGRMAAVGLSEEDAVKELSAYDGLLELAAVNSDRDVTIAGNREALRQLERDLTAREVPFRTLDLDYPFHTRAMDVIEEPLLRSLSGVRSTAPGPAMVSTVTGRLVESRQLDAAYWWKNVRQPVQFLSAARAVHDLGCNVLVEIGPHPVLSGYLLRIEPRDETPVAVVPTLVRYGDGPEAMRAAVCRLIAYGAVTEWEAHFPTPGRVVGLPAYPWQRERHWNGASHWWSPYGRADHPLLGSSLPTAEPSWYGILDRTRLPWLDDHKVGGTTIMPATGYVEAALAAGRRALNTPVELTDLRITRPLALADPFSETGLRVSVSDEDGVVRIASSTPGSASAKDAAEDPGQEHARGRVRRLCAGRPRPVDLDGIRTRLTGRTGAAEHYDRAARAGLSYGPAFQVLTELGLGEGEVLAAYRADDPDEAYLIHPAVLDGALQAGTPLLADSGANQPFLPVAVEEVQHWAGPARTGFVHVRARATGSREVCWDLDVTDDAGEVSVRMRGVRLRRVDTAESTVAACWTTVTRALPPYHGRPLESSPFPTPSAVVDDAGTALRGLMEPAEGRPFDQCVRAFSEMNAHFAARTFAALLPEGGTFGASELIAAGVQPRYRKLLDLLTELTTQYGLTQRIQEKEGAAEPRFRLARDPRPDHMVQLVTARFPDQAIVLALYTRCGRNLAEVLRGNVDAPELLFGDADRHLIEQFYEQQHDLRLHNSCAQAVVRSMIRNWPAGRPLRVLEVGAGTGGTTAAVLPVLPAENTTYTFTDVSAAFLPRAQRRFGEHDFIEYRTLDLDRPPAPQGFQTAGYDLVIASHALHAAPDLARALDHVGSLLADGGLLLAVEWHESTHLAPCFGLLDSFWSFHDAPLRVSSPLLSPADWEALLGDRGFAHPARVSREPDSGSPLCSVLVAQRDVRAVPPEVPPPAAADRDAAWIIAAGSRDGDLAEGIQNALLTAGHLSAHRTAPLDQPDEWTSLLPAAGPANIVLILGDGAHDSADPTERAAVRTCVDHAAVLRAAAAACDGLPESATATLWLVTRPCGALPGPVRPLTLADAATWGVARSLANEHPRIAVHHIALERGPAAGDDAQRLCQELLAGSEEREIVLTHGGRFGPRVVQRAVSGRNRDRQPFTLALKDPGPGHRLSWQDMPMPVPGPGQVVIEVRAAALNYHDVMVATDLLPAGAEGDEVEPKLGLECAGTIAAVGDGVTSLAPGDRVCAMAEGSLASHVLVAEELTAPVPARLSFPEAATLPAVFTTVHHSFGRLARLHPEDTVLVHSGAGGVGLAALQFAQAHGNRIIATAGTPGKRELLDSLGVDHVLDSRDPAFGEEVMRVTDGRGVDVVLNSLAGEAIARGLELLRPHGRFVELGKRDIHANGRLLLRPFRNNLGYFSVDLLQMLRADPQRFGCLLTEVMDRVSAGIYRPLLHQTYAAARIGEAFRVLHRARHVGKIVVSFDERPPTEPRPTPFRPDPEGTYLVTGGLDGFGAATAVRLAGQGARHIVLAGRRGADTPGADGLLRTLRDLGAEATARTADVTDRGAVQKVLDAIDATGHPLRGVVHAAMVLDDAPLKELDDERFSAVLAPKVQGALVLDSLTRDRDLDLFLLFSSASCLIGNINQAPYAAGNLFLEALVRARREEGLPGTAVAWGAVTDVGYVARRELTDMMERVGLGIMTSGEALDILENLLALGDEVTVVGRLDWDALRRVMPVLRTPRFAGLLSATDTARRSSDLRERLVEADGEEAVALVTDTLVRLAADVLRSTPDRIDRSRRLGSLGLDSLLGAELAVVIRRCFGCDLSLMEVLTSRDLNDLAHRILSRVDRRGTTPSDGQPEPVSSSRGGH
ncbi:SDR family NAD(P)-dependent oxidoreductase [Streptomyces tsukubensis]